MSNPADLNTVPQPNTDKNYFNFKATGLKIDQTYAIKFQWVYSDGTVSDWSPGKFVTTSTELVPPAPTATVTGGAGFIKVELPTFPTNALRVDIRIAGGTFGSGTVVADSFTSAGVKTIAALGAASPGNAYIVTLLTVTPSKINGDPTSATTVYVTDPSAALVVTAPQDPFAPIVKAGLASVIVEWSGKKSDGTDLTTTGFSGAKVHIGTSAGFTPSDNNWVHTLNFANGSNRVSIGVGSIIDKSNNTTLQYATAYYVKLVAVNANGVLSSAVSASNNPVTVLRVAASEIDAGILRADAYIQAGADGGQRAVLSGSTSPFIIYGTDGTTKLLEYSTSGTTGTLAIKGSGTFSGDISAASGTFTGNVTTSGNISASNGLFSVNNGLLTAQSGTIGGWTITGSLLESTAAGGGQIRLAPATANGGKISLLYGGVEKITIDAVEGIVGPSKTVGGNTGPAFKITPSGTAEFRGTIYAENGIFTGNITSSATISGGTITGGTITGARVQTETDSYYGSIRMGYTEAFGTGSTLEVVGANGTITGQLYQFNNGNELILRHGSSRTVGGYPTSSAFLSLNPYTTSLGYTDSTGGGLYELNISADGSHNLLGTLAGLGNGNIALSLFRNISAGSTVKSTSDSSGYIGDIYIQF